jgi:hypothetical protein
MATGADIGRVGRKYDPELTTSHIIASGVIMRKSDISETFK